MAKKLIVNCVACDARSVSEATLQAYESIMINTSALIVSPESKDMLAQYGVTMNCAAVHCLPREQAFQLRVVNGSHQIKAADPNTGKSFLLVNGSLEVGEGAGQQMESLVGLVVNGTMTCPESMSGFLSSATVNGTTVCYPDGAIVLKRNAVIDRVFALRAKEKLYWSAKRMILVDPQLDAGVLAAKGASFCAGEVILAESKVEAILDRIDEKAQLIIVPDGTAVILDDVTLEPITVKKQGSKLYIIGDLDIPAEAGQLLESLEYLNVQGDVKVSQALKDLLLEKADHIEGKVIVRENAQKEAFLGRTLEDKLSVRVSRELLEREEKGIRIVDCVNVTLEADVPTDLIFDRLTIEDCVKVTCTPEQEAAVSAVCTDVANINGGQEGGDLLGGILGGVKDILTTKMINAVEYVL